MEYINRDGARFPRGVYHVTDSGPRYFTRWVSSFSMVFTSQTFVVHVICVVSMSFHQSISKSRKEKIFTKLTKPHDNNVQLQVVLLTLTPSVIYIYTYI